MTLTARPDLMKAAINLSGEVRQQADQAERQRRVDPTLVRKMADAGLFHAFVPRTLGGGECDVATVLRIIERISIDDGSAGWVAMIGITTGPAAAFLEPAVARHIYGDGPGVITGGAIAPKGRAVIDGEGYRVTGRWPFVSGCEHSDWLLGSCLVYDGDEMRKLPSGEPELRQVFFPKSEVEIIDTWDVAGLRATGSHDMAVRDVVAPQAHSLSLTGGRAYQDRPLYRFPVFGLLSVAVASVTLGIARRALDEITTIAPAKRSVFATRLLSETPATQTELAQAEASLRSARAFLFETVESVWQSVERADTPTTQERAVLRLAATNATTSAARATDIAYQLGGGSSIYSDNILQRQFRDVHTATQHIATSPATYEMAGRVFLGLSPGTPML